MPEWKLHALENDRKITPRKITENWQLEFARMENARPGKCQNGNCTPRKMTEKSHPGKWQKMHNWNLPEWKMHTLENARMEIARPGKWQKNHTPENDRKLTIWICQNGKYTPLKMPEQKLHALETDRKLTHQCWNGGIPPLQISTILGQKCDFHYCLIFPKCQSWGPLGSIWT